MTRFPLRLFGLLVFALAALPAALAQTSDAPLRVFLRAGPKTHGPGQHDHPRFLTEWSELLRERGAVVDGALAFPSRAQLEACDVLVCYAAENGSMDAAQREDLARFLARGGGIVALHDAVCGDDAPWFQTVIGGAWEHGHSKWQEGRVGLFLAPEEHPITRGIPHFEFDDEIYYDLHMQPDVQVLGSSFRTVFDIEPQLWTYEKDGYRAFVSIQGHNVASFSHPAWRTILLRGIAWAGRRDADLLVRESELAGLRYPPGGPTAPELAHESFVLHPDFEIELAASEPVVANPISIDWDARGRAWVACTPGYPYKQEFSGIPAHDSIVILDDSDGDGLLETQSVFAEGLDLVTSVLVHERGALVTASPQILYLADTDGDGRADASTVLYSGFGYGDTHAVISNMRWGPDGWVYATQGYSGGGSNDIRGVDGVSHGPIRNGLLRFRPDGSAIELVSSYGSNTWGLDFSPGGELFFTMANGAHLRQLVLPEAQLALGRVGGVNSWTDLPDHDRVAPLSGPGVLKNEQIDFVGGFTAAAGCLILDAAGWPAAFRGDHLVCEPTVNLVHRDELAPRGVTYTATRPRAEEFLASRDNWFRPVHLRTGPDGALYVLDFYNQAVIHNDTRGPKHGPTNAAVRPDRDREHGRIWRIFPRGERAAVAAPATTPAGLLADLEREDGWYRSNAMRLLRESGDTNLAPRLAALASAAALPAARIAALWTLAETCAASAAGESALGALADPDQDVRANAARVLASLGLSSSRIQAALLAVAADADAPRARLQALVALRNVEFPDDDTLRLLAVSHALDDDWSRSALLGALARNSAAAIGNAAQQGFRDLELELIRQSARSRDGLRIDEALFALEFGSGNDEHLALALRTLEAELGAGFVPSTGGVGLNALRRILERGELASCLAALPLVERWDTDGLLDAEVVGVSERLLAELRDETTEPGRRLACLPALLSIEALRAEAIAAGADLVAAYQPLEVQRGAIEALGPFADAAPLLCRRLPELGASARAAAIEALLARRAGVAALLDAVEAGDLRARFFGAREAHRLRSFPDEALAARAQALLARGTDSSASRLAELLPLVDRPGDVAHGKLVFAQQCGTCHRYEGEGARIGPELTGMGSHGVESLLGVILDPNAEIDPAYVEYAAESLDGVLSTGILVRETSESIVLRNTGGDVELARADLAGLRSTGLSLMPTGLEAMGAEDLRDLLSFLTAPYRGWRVLDLRALCNTSNLRGLFDPEKDWSGWGRFTRYGVIDVAGVPFQVHDPAVLPSGLNALTLRGGATQDWACRTSYPQRVELPIGSRLEQVHVLGGVGGWAYPWNGQSGEDVLRWTWHFEGGHEESVILRNGVEFADWIGHDEVPGSIAVSDLVAPDAPGQVRRFALRPPRDEVVERIVLESFDSFVSPVFLALTVQLEGTPDPLEAAPALPERVEADVLLLGGGSSHDFARWFGEADRALLAAGGRRVHYSEDPRLLLTSLDADDVLVLSTNQALPPEVRAHIDAHVAHGGGVLFLHAGTWDNWPDWTARNSGYLGTLAASHEPLGPFTVSLAPGAHPLTRGLPAGFEITDELYRVAPPAGAGAVTVLASGRSAQGGESYPVLWTSAAGPGRVVGLSLGHDGSAHGHPAFGTLLSRAVHWLASPH